MGQVLLEGAIDMHCHFGPESVVGAPHAVDAFDAASEAIASGMAGLVLKSHDFPSNSVAYLVGRQFDGLRVFGSVCCDFCIGGLNASAVETCLRDGAAVVWLPTISSRQEVENGVAAILKVPGPAISTLDEDGELREEVREILALVTEHDAIVATGHISTEEHFAVARAYGGRARLVVTHAMNPGAGPHLSVADCVELADLGAVIELTAATCMGSRGPSVTEVISAINAVGTERVVLSTDYGWNEELPHPAAGLQSYVDALWAAGATEAELRRMACDTPARPLRLP